MTEYLSHIRKNDDGRVMDDTRLADHLAAVANAVARVFPNDSGAKQMGVLAGLCHDFGKATTFFQTYLRTGHPHAHDLQRHAFISALYGAFEAYRMRDAWDYVEVWDPLLLYLAIKHHHGDLANLTDDVGKQWIREGDIENITNNLHDSLEKTRFQVADLWKQKKEVADELEAATRQVSSGLPEGWHPDVAAFLAGAWTKTFDMLVRDARKYERQADERESAARRPYIRLLEFFSALIDADKRDAAQLQTRERPTIPKDIVDMCVAAKAAADAAGHPSGGSSAMSWVRQGLYERATKRARNAASDERLFTLTAPTGSGKTLTALSVAMQLRERSLAAGRSASHIVYAMPFTSIIDQNHKVAKDVLGRLDDFRIYEYRYLVAHHHLAPVKAKDAEKELPVDEVLLLQEGWDSEIIVTTFVQLFETLIGYHNRSLKRFHRLRDAVLILDEVQSLPAEQWALIGNVLHLLSEQCGTRVILMTATQPKLLGPNVHFVELAGEPEEVAEMFRQLNRIDLHVALNRISVAEFIAEFVEHYRTNRSYLLVFNTIRTSLDVFKGLEDRLDPVSGLTYLSSNVVPVMRRKRVDELTKASRAGKPMVIVSTQVVEAGVDLDVDVVYRELAPLDSIVQAAGRCNRDNRGQTRGSVYVMHLEPTPPAKTRSMERVYGRIKADATMETLQKACAENEQCTLSESEFPRIVSDYFTALAARESKGGADEIWNAMERLHFSPPLKKENPVVCDFHLIESYPQYVDLFITCNKEAEQLWEWYLTCVVREKDLRYRRINYLEHRAEFQGYVLSVKMDRALLLGAQRDDRWGVWYLPSVANQSDIYHPVTGLARDPGDISSFM